jgi:hypothetical protein
MAAAETSTPMGDNEVAWYWPDWAAQAPLPTFRVRDTESSHGRYAQEAKTILVKDLVKFHGHACNGLFRGVMALSMALTTLFPDGVVDRTDLRVLSRNSPCLGDVAAYHILRTSGTVYQDVGADYFDQRDRAAVLRRHTRRLEALG